MANEVKSINGNIIDKILNGPAEKCITMSSRSYKVHLGYEDEYGVGYKIGFERNHVTHNSPLIGFDELIILRDMINEELAKFEIDG